jgi:hypothetical protein
MNGNKAASWPPALTHDEYRSDMFHVEKRNRLDDSVKSVMFTPFPDDAFARQREEANFWLQVHEGLLGTSRALPEWSEQLLAEDNGDRLDLMGQRIAALANQLLHHAHSHHHIEDHHFFPVFLQVFPQLERPLDLLEKDHEVLTEVLDSVEQSAIAMQQALRADRVRLRDAVLMAAEKTRDSGNRLDRLFRRHIADEEEICLPSLLRM